MKTFALAALAVALTACWQQVGESSPQAQELGAPEVEAAPTVHPASAPEVAETVEQDEALPPATETKQPEPEQSEPTPPAAATVVTTTFPPLDEQFFPPPDDGPISMELRIADSDLIAIVSLSSVTPAVETITEEGQTGYMGALKFTFAVQELLKSPVGVTPTQVVSMVGSMQGYAERSDAQVIADRMASERDTQWDDRNAIIFLATHSLDYPATSSDDLYYMAYIDYTYGLGDGYSLASERHRLWLPEARTGAGGAAGSTTERRFLIAVPEQSQSTNAATANSSNDAETPSISLTDLKATISRINAEMNVDTSEWYQQCVTKKYEYAHMRQVFAARGRNYDAPYIFDSEIVSGLAAGTVVLHSTWHSTISNGPSSRSEFSGADAELFRVREKTETTRTETREFRITNNYRAFKKTAELLVWYDPLETVRPLPAGTYNLTWKFYRSGFALCDPSYVNNNKVTVTVTPPDGTLHEAFFDPVTDGSAVAADSTNGILKPTSFTDANSASASLQRIEWASDTVKVKVSPHTGLTGQVVDFIELDGSVSLSLNVDDATVDAANNTLSWTVAEQPWHNGDKLMLRIRKALSAPEDLSVSLSGGTYTISWSAVTGATDYRAQYRTGGSEADWTDLDATTGTSQTFSPEGGVACGTTYEFRVQARSDGTIYPAEWSPLSESTSHTNSAGACNRSPVFTSSTYAFTVSEDASVWPDSHVVGTLSASDPDEGDFVTYHITAGNVGGAFNISSGHHGADIVVWAALDYETTSSYTLTVEARDGKAGGTSSATVEISVTDVAE